MFHMFQYVKPIGDNRMPSNPIKVRNEGDSTTVMLEICSVESIRSGSHDLFLKIAYYVVLSTHNYLYSRNNISSYEGYGHIAVSVISSSSSMWVRNRCMS